MRTALLTLFLLSCAQPAENLTFDRLPLAPVDDVRHATASYTTAATTLSGAAAGDYYGWDVEAGGDVNGDGYADLIVGAAYAAGRAGAVYVYHGSAAGFSTTEDTLLIGTAYSAFGSSLASAGDVNGDGFGDVIVGASSANAGMGAAYLFLGSATGVDTTPSMTVNGTVSSESMGSWVAGAGDVDGDGYDEVLVAASGARTFAGEAHIYMGSASGPVAADGITLPTASGSYYTSTSLAGVGDVDGDGYDDVVSCSFGFGAFLYLGNATGLETSATSLVTLPRSGQSCEDVSGAGDVNADGHADVIIASGGANSYEGEAYVYLGSSSGLSTSADTTFASDTPAVFGYFGAAVAGAGDVDADGYDDVIIGEYGYDGDHGRFYLYLGSSAGVPDVADSILDGTDASGFFGCAVAGIGDSDGDGFDDVAVGAYGISSTRGAAYVYTSERSDVDGDGYDRPEDCDDSDDAVYPGAPEIVGDSIDQDCDDEEVCYADADVDGYAADTGTVVSLDTDCLDRGEATVDAPTGDCDDADIAVYPGATEGIGDGVDQDCDGGDLCYVNADGDAYRADTGTVASVNLSCADAGEARDVVPAGDCNDADASVYPGAPEVGGDGIDQDCNGLDVPGDTGDESPFPDDTAGDTGTPKEDEGCGCTNNSSPSLASLAVLFAALLVRRRR